MSTILDPVEIPGLEQIETGYIDDAVAWAERELELGNPRGVLRYRNDLEGIIRSKTWRASAAANLLLKAQRMVFAHVLTSEHQEEICRSLT